MYALLSMICIVSKIPASSACHSSSGSATKPKVIPKKVSKAATNVETDVSGRRTSSRLSTATFMTYNEDVIESSVFDKIKDEI